MKKKVLKKVEKKLKFRKKWKSWKN